MNGIDALIKGTPESSLTLSTLWGHRERTTICEPGSRFHQILNPQAPWSLLFYRIVKIKYLLFKPPSLWYFYYSGLSGLSSWRRHMASVKNVVMDFRLQDLGPWLILLLVWYVCASMRCILSSPFVLCRYNFCHRLGEQLYTMVPVSISVHLREVG